MRWGERLASVWMQEGSRADPSMLDGILGHVLDAPGKRTRPAITILASKFHPYDHDLPLIMATAVELLHIATLVHDDTVDNSDVRRGKATVSSRWGRNVAVLVGDYVFATSATFVCDTKNVRVIRRFSETIMEALQGRVVGDFRRLQLVPGQRPLLAAHIREDGLSILHGRRVGSRPQRRP